jgi:hypothetical protein
VNTSKATMKLDPADTSHYSVQSKTYIIGQNDGTMSWGGLYDGTNANQAGAPADAINALMFQAIAAETSGGPAVPVMLAPGGWAPGAIAIGGLARHTTYEVNAVFSDVVSVSGDIQLTGGFVGGDILSSLTPITASTNHPAVDDLALSNRGAFVTLHVLANTFASASTFKIQHSVDNSTWADLFTGFTSVGAGLTSAQSGTIGSGTIINRYIRLVSTLSGTGSVTVTATLSRY